MRKKYLSALLFGALLFASAGTFTSCKDYDDDIKNLQEQIDGKATLEELQSQLETMQADVTSAKTTAEEAKTIAEEALQKAEQALAGGGASEGISEEQLAQAIADAKAEIEAQIEKLASLEDVQTEIDNLKEELTQSFVTSDALNALQEDIDALEVKISNIIGKVLNSLVFQPSLYIDGIEATEYAWMSYTYKKSGTTTQTTFTDNEGVGCTVTTKPEEWVYEDNQKAEFNPIVNVQYHINPSKAEVTKENLSFLSNDAEVINTRSSVANPVIAEGDIKVENGILTVPMQAKGSLIKDQTQGEGSIFALQANVKTESGEDRVITSDYSVLYSSVIDPQAIAYSVEEYNGFDIKAKDCSYTSPKDELWASVEEAIQNEPTLRVAYNSHIDLSEVLNIHYNHTSLTKTNGTHKVWAWGEEKAYGLHYDFALIQYNVGTNETSDSKYVDESQIAQGIVAPRMVNADGTTASQPGVSSVGKHPLIRVRVLDEQNRVVLHAYVKVEIVKTVENLVTTIFDKGDALFGCNNWDAKLTWSEISNQLIEKAGVSKEEFEALYKLDVNSLGEAKQFNFADNKFTECVNASVTGDIFGKVKENADPQGTTNSVLVWSLTDEDQQRIYEENADHSKTIYVRYVRTTSSPSGTSNIAPIYLPIKITVTKPEGTVVKKIQEYWYNNSINTRLNVPYPKDNGNSLDYTVDLNQVWEGNQPKFGQGNDYASYTDAILSNLNGDPVMDREGGYRYYFTAGNNMDDATVTSPIDNSTYTLVDLDGETYKLFAGLKSSAVRVDYADDIFGKQHEATTENEKLYALSTLSGVYQNEALYATRISDNVTEKIAEISYDNNIPQIKYQTGDIAKALLNAYDHSDAKLFAYIGIVAYSECGVAMSLKDNVYPAYFLRPITMKDNNAATFEDAEANGSVINIAEVFDFVDWRDVAFKDGNDYKNVWLYAYYGLKGAKMITEDITTNLNGNDINTTKLSAVTDKIKLSQIGSTSFDLSSYNTEASGTKTTWDAIVNLMGQIKYENNGNNVSNFDIRIPVEFTYDWGTIRAYITCHVVDTMGNQD